jgi:hypothetical protein
MGRARDQWGIIEGNFLPFMDNFHMLAAGLHLL